MIERIVENWLTKVNEKSFQAPFCQMLIGEGYKVVHLSRHGPFEEGKDVLAIAPDGTPCAYQLKGSDGGKITQKEWAKYADQIARLVEIPIKHPSIDESQNRRVYFVTNGELDEEVRVEITNRNADRKRRQYPELSTILKGELLARFSNIHTDLWPMQLTSEKELLELYLADGTGYLDKPKFAGFLETLLLNGDTTKKIEGQRNLASAALFASYALSPFTIAENNIAIVEGWVIFLACLIAFVEKNHLDEKNWRDTVHIAEGAIEMALFDLTEELQKRTDFITGNSLVDAPFIRGRITCLLGFVSAYILLMVQQKPDTKIDEWFSNFLITNQRLLLLWGEYATPQFMAIYWALKPLGYSILADRLIFSMLKGIIEQNINKNGIPDPYHPLSEVVLTSLGLSDTQHEETYKGRSYSLDSLIQLLARRGYRGALAENWRQITLLHFAEFEPETAWQYCLWHCEDGVFHETMPKAPQSWKELVDKASSINLEKIPTYFLDNPAILLLFLLVYPHRLQPDVVKYIDKELLKTFDA